MADILTASQKRVCSSKPKVGLVNVVMDGDYQYPQEIPLGLASLASFLRNKSYEVVMHQCFASSGEDAFEKAARIEADVFGFQINMINFTSARRVAELVKARDRNARVIYGGPFLLPLCEEIAQRESAVDFLVVGEGELTLLELLEAIADKETDFSTIDGLVWKDHTGRIIKNTRRRVIENLDDLPFPARDFFDEASRDPRDNALMESVRVISSRGCIGRCSFCLVNLQNEYQKGKRWRGRSPKHVVDELEHLSKRYGAWLFNFSDSSFEDPGSLGKQRSREICEEILRRRLKISAKIYIRCDTMDPVKDRSLLELYKQAGIDVIIAGAEAGSDYELELYEKRATVEDNLRTMKLIQEIGKFYALFGFIMFGPDSTVDSVRQNIEFLKSVNCCDNLLQISNVLVVFRGCKLYHRLKEQKRLVNPENYWEPPKYTFLDPIAGRIAQHWENTLARFEFTRELNSLQVNLANLIARLTNPMNRAVFERFEGDYYQLRSNYAEYSKELSDLQYEHFVQIIEMAKSGCENLELDECRKQFFSSVCNNYIETYRQLYDGFLKKVFDAGFGMRGLVFRHFTSALNEKGVDRSVGAEPQ